MITYEIADGSSAAELAKAVNKFMRDGYQPIGSMAYVPHQTWGDSNFGGNVDEHYYQPVFKMEEDK